MRDLENRMRRLEAARDNVTVVRLIDYRGDMARYLEDVRAELAQPTDKRVIDLTGSGWKRAATAVHQEFHHA